MEKNLTQRSKARIGKNEVPKNRQNGACRAYLLLCVASFASNARYLVEAALKLSGLLSTTKQLNRLAALFGRESQSYLQPGLIIRYLDSTAV